MEDLAPPHWLLDIHEWRLYEYTQIDPPNEGEIQYGIVSYTWGKWRDRSRSAEDKPDNVRWDVPYVEDLPLERARELMCSINIKYVWWDWMCVPQHSETNPLTPDEVRIAGEEIAKQMGIYRRAHTSIVWLHRIEWDKHPLLGCYLTGSMVATNLIPFRSNLEGIRYCVKRIQEEEPWLTSGWTLQEGVLLPDTPLLDKHGKTLKVSEFLGDNAVVSSISASINRVASDIAQAFMHISWQQYCISNPPPGLERFLGFIAASAENEEFTATFLADLLRTGLVGYTNNAPLFLLAGRVSRRFSCPEDHYWALLGAMGITVDNPWYNDGRGIAPIISAFFEPLLERHQWRLFLIAKMDQRSEWGAKYWPERISEGHVLPLEIYLGTVTLFADLPLVTLLEPHKLLMEPKKSEDPDQKPKISFIDKKQRLYTRRYLQSTYENGFISIDDAKPGNYANSIFLPIANVAPLEDVSPNDETTPPWKKVRKGFRCIEIEHLSGSNGRFWGVADVWADEAGEQGKEVTMDLFVSIDFDYFILF